MTADDPGEGFTTEVSAGDRVPRHVRVSHRGGVRSYPVVVARGALTRLPELLQGFVSAHRWAVIADETVAGHYGDAAQRALASTGAGVDVVTFPAGESSKTREQWGRLTDSLLAAGHARDSAVVALGGGVTGDLAGFVAATFMRGIPVVQVPTSIVAMVDASIGGKTGVDSPAGKNLVGAFHSPVAVVSDPDTVRTLPLAERAQGLVEAVKHGAILDQAYLATMEGRLDDLMAGDPEVLEEVVQRSVELKAGVVSDDEREAGMRQILNFGHTLGHALEAASDYRLTHGAAVGVGMVLEARLGEQLGVTEKGTASRLAEVVRRLDLPVAPPAGLEPDRVRAHLSRDKKQREGQLRFVLLRSAGAVHRESDGWSHAVPQEHVDRILRGSERFNI